MIKVVLHRVAVKPLDIDEWNEDRKKAKELGFALPESQETARMKSSVDIGTVVEIGRTAFKEYTDEIPIKVGDLVGYVKNAGKLVKHPTTQEELYVMNDEDIVTIFTEE